MAGRLFRLFYWK